MRPSECVQSLKAKSEAYFSKYNLHADGNGIAGMTKELNLIFVIDEASVVKMAMLLGVYSLDDAILQLPYHPENPMIPAVDRDAYLALRDFGAAVNVPELTEVNISFDPFAAATAQLCRRLDPPRIHRNEQNEIVSVYSLDTILALAATFHKALAIVTLEEGNYVFYFGVTES